MAFYGCGLHNKWMYLAVAWPWHCLDGISSASPSEVCVEYPGRPVQRLAQSTRDHSAQAGRQDPLGVRLRRVRRSSGGSAVGHRDRGENQGRLGRTTRGARTYSSPNLFGDLVDGMLMLQSGQVNQGCNHESMTCL